MAVNISKYYQEVRLKMKIPRSFWKIQIQRKKANFVHVGGQFRDEFHDRGIEEFWEPYPFAYIIFDQFWTIIRPHRSTTYVDAAYCYPPSSVVCRFVTLVSPAKRLNWSRCRLGWGLGWAEETTY